MPRIPSYLLHARRRILAPDVATVLQLARGGAAAAAVGALGKGLDFSTDGQSHQLMTYVGFYGAGALFVDARAPRPGLSAGLRG